MPHIIPQPDAAEHGSGVMRLYSADEARQLLRLGKNKWAAVAREIEPTWVGTRKLYTDASINRYLRRQTKKRATPPRTGTPAKPAAPKLGPKSTRRAVATDQGEAARRPANNTIS